MTIASCSSVLSEDKTTEAIREQALAILRAGLQARDEANFWPAMHAAEGLTLAGHGCEVRKALEPWLATETDARRRCGLARELIRAGDLSKVGDLARILTSPDSYGHIHAAESLFKVGEVGDAAAIEAHVDFPRLRRSWRPRRSAEAAPPSRVKQSARRSAAATPTA